MKKKLQVIILEAELYGTVKKENLPFLIEQLRKLVPKEETVKYFTLNNDYVLSETTKDDEEGMTAQELRDAICDMIRLRNEHIDSSVKSIEIKQRGIYFQQSEVKKLQSALNELGGNTLQKLSRD